MSVRLRTKWLWVRIPLLSLKLEYALSFMVSVLLSMYNDSPRLEHTIKTNCIKIRTVDPNICSILTFLKKSLRIASILLNRLHSIKWPNFYVGLPLLPEILDNICIPTISFPVKNVIYFAIELSFLIKLFSYMTKKVGTNI